MNNTAQKILCFAFVLAVLVQTILNSWVDEDAYVTFRVVDNFVNGFGLRWNTNERVQAYTNPLWMLLHIPVYAVTRNIIVSTCLLGWGCLVAGLAFSARAFCAPPLRFAALFLAPLLISPANAAYFTSGLEAPILSALFAAFGYVVVRRPKNFWFWCSCITALSMLARLDIIILYLPVWIYLLWSQFKAVRWRQLVAGALPLASWILFSLFYYGFILPNTALAKLGGHLPIADYITSGIAYVYDFILADPWSFTCVVVAIIYFPCQLLRGRTYETVIAAAIAGGIGLYCAYVVEIGGAQLSLRMWSVPIFAVTWLWAWRFPRYDHLSYASFVAVAFAMQFLLSLDWETRHQVPMINKAQFGGNPWSYHLFQKTGYKFYSYSLANEDLSKKPDYEKAPLKVTATGVIGIKGFYDGPYEVIIDPMGLSDPLLARLPALDKHLMKVGDVLREIPKGYEEAILTGKTDQMQAPLAEYYNKILLITRGDLWDWERLKTIMLFNLGTYDGLRDEYIRDYYPRKLDGNG